VSRGSRSRRRSPLGAIALACVALIAGALIAYKSAIAVGVGPGWDTFAFLSNAAEFAGRGCGYSELHRPPVLSLLTALAWRLGAPMHESVIQWIDGALSFSGVVAFYLLARKRFSPLLAAVGALAFFSVQPLWLYLGSGYTDFASVGIGLWMLLALIGATERNPWYYIPAGLLFLTAVMTRYTSILALFPALVFLVLRGAIFRHAKPFAWAVAVMAAAYVPIGRLYARRFGDAFFPFVLAFGVSEAVTAPSGEGAVRSAGWFYVRSLPELLSPEGFGVIGWVLVLVAIVGLGSAAWSYLSATRPSVRHAGLALAGVGIMVGGQAVGGLAIRQASIMLGVWLVWRMLAPREDAPGQRTVLTAALDATLVAWLLTYFSFHGNQAIQVPRYLIPMAPGLIWLLMLGWQGAVIGIRRTLSTRPDEMHDAGLAGRFAAPLGLGVLVVISVALTVGATTRTPDRMVAAARDSARWLMTQPAEKRAAGPIYSDLWPLTAWYARTAVRPMPFFKDADAYEHEVAKTGASYFVTIRSRRYADFDVAHRSGPAVVLERTRDSARTLPRVAYLGKSWDNYLETVTGNRFYLMSDAGRYGWEGRDVLDILEAGQLAEYDALALFGVRWKDRTLGESNLRSYVENGGSVVIDASRNLGELPYEMGDTVMFDTVIQRGTVASDAQVRVEPDFAARHPAVGTIDRTPFSNENGEGWYGAEYSALPGTTDLDVLATVGGKPAIVMRRVGKGRVYWVGYNLVWHAFLTENPGERRLIGAVFDDAIAHAAGSRNPAGTGTEATQ